MVATHLKLGVKTDVHMCFAKLIANIYIQPITEKEDDCSVVCSWWILSKFGLFPSVLIPAVEIQSLRIQQTKF